MDSLKVCCGSNHACTLGILGDLGGLDSNFSRLNEAKEVLQQVYQILGDYVAQTAGEY